MPIYNLADRLVTVTRRTALVLDSVAAASSLAVSRQPAGPAQIAVTVSGSPGTGTVTVSGTVDGSPGSESLDFAAPGRKETLKRFSALDPFATTGLADESPAARVEASAVGSDGSPVEGLVVVASSWPARKDAGGASWPAPVPGSAPAEATRFFFAFTEAWTPRDGDILTDERTSETWLVVGHPAQHGGGARAPHHWEVAVRRRV